MNKKYILPIVVLCLLVAGIVNAERLPTVGGDSGNWGGILNRFLLFEHTPNGSHKNVSVDGTLEVSGEVNGRSIDGDNYVSTSNALYLQPNKDSTARVRFFSNTTGSPLISMYGYNPVTDARPWMYLGMFDYTGVDGYMRTVLGASGGYDDVAAKIEIQSPYQVRITGVDSVQNVGTVRIAASKEITIHPETVAETDSAKHLIIDTTGGVTADGTDVELSTNAGNLVLNPAGDVLITGAYTGTCVSGKDIVVVGGIITGCI